MKHVFLVPYYLNDDLAKEVTIHVVGRFSQIWLQTKYEINFF
jgi:hypothetical protein